LRRRKRGSEEGRRRKEVERALEIQKSEGLGGIKAWEEKLRWRRRRCEGRGSMEEAGWMWDEDLEHGWRKDSWPWEKKRHGRGELGAQALET
jgi:hypothetical protein